MKFVSQLAPMFAELDADVLARQTAWAIERAAALRALVDELKSQRRALGEWNYYDKLFACVGGKTWYQILNGASEAGIRVAIEKNCAAVAAARNAKISTKLEKAGTTSIGAAERASRTTDGFDGVYHIDTNTGAKLVEIRTIVAGGYNIQCLHQRTLVKVR